MCWDIIPCGAGTGLTKQEKARDQEIRSRQLELRSCFVGISQPEALRQVGWLIITWVAMGMV
jgi:hypothetical protein